MVGVIRERLMREDDDTVEGGGEREGDGDEGGADDNGRDESKRAPATSFMKRLPLKTFN